MTGEFLNVESERIQAAADRNIRRFGLTPLGTERAEVSAPGKE